MRLALEMKPEDRNVMQQNLADRAERKVRVAPQDLIGRMDPSVRGDAVVIADELLIKFGGDRLDETLRNLEAYRQALREV